MKKWNGLNSFFGRIMIQSIYSNKISKRKNNQINIHELDWKKRETIHSVLFQKKFQFFMNDWLGQCRTNQSNSFMLLFVLIRFRQINFRFMAKKNMKDDLYRKSLYVTRLGEAKCPVTSMNFSDYRIDSKTIIFQTLRKCWKVSRKNKLMFV